MRPHQATASNLSFYDNFASTKNSSFEVSDDVTACDLRFGPIPQSKALATPMGTSSCYGGTASPAPRSNGKGSRSPVHQFP